MSIAQRSLAGIDHRQSTFDRFTAVTVLAAAFLACAGCHSASTVHLVPLGSQAIEPSVPLVTRLNVNECVYWTNESGRLCVAMSQGPLSQPSGAAGGRSSFQLSLELGEPAVDSVRNYAADRRTLRAIWHEGIEHLRFASFAGLVTVTKSAGGQILHGRFRINCKKQGFNIFFGWAFGAEYLILGEFEALPDEQRGRQISTATESAGLERVPPPAKVEAPSHSP